MLLKLHQRIEDSGSHKASSPTKLFTLHNLFVPGWDFELTICKGFELLMSTEIITMAEESITDFPSCTMS